eukprot:TRINITY_DN4130_c0_g1_i1.p1 TRINITY_DN4130_c0_g1~~TRINITY_DN4130_c0_g1_i1.p1  ORF type:complete len:279 (-),score=52.13 TRINITY_DN4130_c0_g1_i1:590-1426(-)
MADGIAAVKSKAALLASKIQALAADPTAQVSVASAAGAFVAFGSCGGAAGLLGGIIWMDQAGVFGCTDIPFSAPDLAMSFGDTSYSRLDEITHTIDVDVTGPAWQWMNNKDGYLTFVLLKKIGFHYHFEFNEDYSSVQIYPSINLGRLGKWSVPKVLMSFTMVLQKPPKGLTCPASTLYADRSRYAKWDRVSSGLLSPLVGKYGVFHYYVYQIVDGDGNRVQPYYDACVAHGAKETKPFPKLAAKLGIDALAVGEKGSTSFVGVRSASMPVQKKALAA